MTNHTLTIENQEYKLSDSEYKRMQQTSWKEIKGIINGRVYTAKHKKFLLDNGKEVALVQPK